MELKFYYDYNEFIKDFDNNLKEYKNTYSSADINYFVNEYLSEYSCFYGVSDFTYEVTYRMCYEWSEMSFIFRGIDDLCSRDENIDTNFYDADETPFFIKVNYFFKVDEYGDKINEIDYIKYKNFQMAVPKIVKYLYSKIDTEFAKMVNINSTGQTQQTKTTSQPQQEKIQKPKMELDYNGLFDKVMYEDLGSTGLVKLLKKQTNNYDIDLLKALLCDLGLYYSTKKDELESEISSIDIEERVKYYKERGSKPPIIQPVENTLKMLQEMTKDIKPRNNTKSLPNFGTYDLERMFFPLAFFILYDFKRMIQEKIQEKTKPTLQPEQEQIQKPKFTTFFEAVDVAVLVKSLIENGNIETKKGVSEEYIYREFCNFLGLELGSTTLSQHVLNCTHRKKKSSTYFLECLTHALSQHFEKNIK